MNHPADPTASPARQATFREFLAVAFRRRGIILGLFFVTTLTVLVIVLTTPLSYVSSGRVLLRRGEQTSALQAGRQVYSEWEQDLGSEVELVKSDPVLEHAQSILAAEPLPGGRVPRIDPSSLDVEVMGKSNVLGIAYVDRAPEVARKVCDALMRSYVNFHQVHLGMIGYPKAFFDTSLADVNRQLADALVRRGRYTSQAQVADVAEERRGLVNEISSLRLRESDLNSDLAEARANVRVMRDLQRRPEIGMPLSANPAGADVLYELERRLVDQESRVVQLLERYREESPEVQDARQTVARIRALLDREVNSRIEVAQSRVQVLESQLQAVRDDLTDRQVRLATMPGKETALGELDREVSVLRTRIADLVEKSDLVRITQNTTSNLDVLVLDWAGPARAANAHDWVRIALAPAFSLLVGVGIAFFVDGLDITVRTAGQAEEAADVPVLASLSERRRRRA